MNADEEKKGHLCSGGLMARDSTNLRGRPVNEPFLRDTVNVPYCDGKALEYSSIRPRTDFRDPNTMGDSFYHCHLLQQEDGGMMGLIRLEP